MVMWRFVIPIVLLVGVIVTGTLVYHSLENWNYLDSAFFSVVTVTTIGYGDLTPKTNAGKIFTMFFAFSGIAIAFYVISLVGKFMSRKHLRENLMRNGRIGNRRGVKKVRR